METPPFPEIPPPASPPVSTTLLAKLLNVFALPGEVFEEVKLSRPLIGNWLAPTLLAAMVGIISTLIIFSQPAFLQKMREQQQKMFDAQVKAGKMSQAKADEAVEMAQKFTGPATLKIAGSVSAVIFSFVRVFWWALVLWLLARFFLKTRIDYIKALEIAGLATMISLLGSIVALLLSVSLQKNAGPNLALALDQFDSKNTFHVLLAAVNIFTFWFIGVMSVGLARLARVPFGRAFILVLSYWLAVQFFLIFIVNALMGLAK
jgi:hypothetical protein